MDTSARAYLLAEMKSDPALGPARMAEAARLLINYVRFLNRNDTYLETHELQAQQWSAMVYLEDQREATAGEIIEAFEKSLSSNTYGSLKGVLNKVEMLRLLRLTQSFLPELNAFPELLKYADLTHQLIRDPNKQAKILLDWTQGQRQRSPALIRKDNNIWDEPMPEHLVGRENQVSEFKKHLWRIRQQQPASPTLYEWYGGPGIGKSQLTNLLIRVCQKQSCVYTLINFKKLLLDDYLIDPTLLVEELAKSLIGTEAFENDPLKIRIDTFRQNDLPNNIIDAYFQLKPADLLHNGPAWVEDMRNVTISFIDLINAFGLENKASTEHEISLNRPVALFFDETNYADKKLIDWIEEWIIGPSLATNHCVIVWTARSPWRWQRLDVRRRVHSEPLLPFSLVESKDQIQKYSAGVDLADELLDRVFALTHGHPAANVVALEQIKQWSIVTPSFQDISLEREKELLGTIYNKVVLQYAFQHLSPEETIACQLMALVRLFDTVMLREVLQMVGGNKFKGGTQKDFNELLEQLKRTQLLIWRKGFALDPVLRPIIHNYYRILEPTVFIAVNKVALQVYEHWLVKPADNHNLYVIEELYHSVLLEHAGESISAKDHLNKRLQQYRQWIPVAPVCRHRLERLYDEIKADDDLEKLNVNENLSKQVLTFLQLLQIDLTNSSSAQDQNIGEVARLLLVDNDEDYLAICRDFFDANGYQVFTATTPDEAKEKLYQHRVHLVLLDWRLIDDQDSKDNSGLLFAKTIARAIPKIIVSRFPSWQNVAQAMRPDFHDQLPPAVDFIDKAGGISKLQNAVERQLTKHPPQPLDQDQLQRQIEASFNEDELYDLYLELGELFHADGLDFDLDYENLSGSTKVRKIISLIQYFEQRQLVNILIDACYRQRPHIRWW